MHDKRSIECGDKDQDTDSLSTAMLRRRAFQRRACILSVMAAFSLGLVLGVFLPMFGFGAKVFTDYQMKPNQTSPNKQTSSLHHYHNDIPDIHFPTIYDIQNNKKRNDKDSYAVSFVTDEKVPAEAVFKNAFHLEDHKDTNTMTVKKLDASDGSIKEFTVHRTTDGFFRKSPEVRISKPFLTDKILSSHGNDDNYASVEFVQQENAQNGDPHGIIVNDIYWSEKIEKSLPQGFNKQQTNDWNEYVSAAAVTKLEIGCGRMQNRMVVFEDGKKACARYRQNTDQIQGELFSFYLGQLLNLTNLAPSAASVVDLRSHTWQSATSDIENAQWKSMKPVVLTKWLPDLESAGIPKPFQPLERHLNKLDIQNISLDLDIPKPQQNLLERLMPVKINESTVVISTELSEKALTRFIELAQWSDLIVFDYLIANLDRVVNNLYNFQWNADIMAAPAHNLAKQINSELLVFLDNESGLLHGYRLLKKYEAYHGLLLDNLCVFRRPTINALQQLRENGVGNELQIIFERTTMSSVRDVLPSLPEKSIKVLNDRIDRVLGQVQKCQEVFSSR